MTELPKLKLTFKLPVPGWEPVYVDNKAINMDSYAKDYEVEVEVVQLNLNSGGMRVRFSWPDKYGKNGMRVHTTDVPIADFFKQYDIVSKG